MQRRDLSVHCFLIRKQGLLAKGVVVACWAVRDCYKAESNADLGRSLFHGMGCLFGAASPGAEYGGDAALNVLQFSTATSTQSITAGGIGHFSTHFTCVAT